jgi:hypothetical protein
LASSIRRRLCANDQDLRANVEAPSEDKTVNRNSSLRAYRPWGKMPGAQPITERGDVATRIAH